MADFLTTYWPWAIFTPASIFAIWSIAHSSRRAIRSYRQTARELEELRNSDD